jgi:hypothetical protein
MGALTELPPELVLGWALWIIGGLLLTMWFVRRSASPRMREVAPAGPPTGTVRLSGAHSAVRTVSGTQGTRVRSGAHSAATTRSNAHLAARSASGRPAIVPSASGVHVDAFDELRALLDTQSEPPSAEVKSEK